MAIFEPHTVHVNHNREAEVSVSHRLMRVVQLLTPEQRFLLSTILFLDVCVLCFAALFLFQKISLPF